MTREQFKTRLKQFEGHLVHMYQDSEGHVTIGTGIMLPNPGSAVKKGLVFKHVASGRTASKQEISDEYKRVKNAPKKLKASAYKKYTKLVATETSLNTALEASLKEAEKGALRYFPDLNKLPAPVRFAIIDMVFNMGGKKIHQFKKLKKALQEKNWEVAAKESNRLKIQPSRNLAIKNWIRSAIKKK